MICESCKQVPVMYWLSQTKKSSNSDHNFSSHQHKCPHIFKECRARWRKWGGVSPTSFWRDVAHGKMICESCKQAPVMYWLSQTKKSSNSDHNFPSHQNKCLHIFKERRARL